MTRGSIFVVASFAGWLALAPPIQAHHPVGEVYDEERTVTLEGEISALLIGNPHSVVHLTVSEPGGGDHTWAVEWRPGPQLERQGWGTNALHPGDRVRICGHPGRDPGAFRLYLRTLTHLATGRTAVSSTGDDAAPCD